MKSIKHLLAILPLVVGASSMFAMEEIAVKAREATTLKITNQSKKTVHVQLYEYETGYFKNTYHPKSKSVAVKPGQTIDMLADAQAKLPRALYFDVGEVSSFSTSYKNIPQSIDTEEFVVDVTYEFPVGEDAAKYVIEYNDEFGSKDVSLNWAYIGTPDLVDGEQVFLSQRSKVTEPALHDLLRSMYEGIEKEYPQDEFKEMPRIALCMSGGGFRAMLSGHGFIQGLQQAELLDTITYTSALSGSTWVQGKWLASGATPDDLPEVDKSLRIALNKGLFEPELLEGTVSKMAWKAVKHMFSSQIPMNYDFKARFIAENAKKHSPNLINSYGMKLAEALFAERDDKYSLTLSSLAGKALQGQMPLPIFTAISARAESSADALLRSLKGKEERPKKYNWLEFTPFSVGLIAGTEMSGPAYIPTWALGRKYEKGYGGTVYSVKEKQTAFNSALRHYLKDGEYYAIEPAFNQLLASFGSAFSVSGGEALSSQGLETIAKYFKDVRVFEGLSINNFYDPKEIKIEREDKAPEYVSNKLELKDAGIDFNLPLGPLFNPKRGIDIIIIMDASSDINEAAGQSLKEFRLYAKQYGLQIPDTLEHEETLDRQLDEMKERGDNFTVFGEMGRKDEITVIYIASALNDVSGKLKYGTFKLQYTPEESDELIEFNKNLVLKRAGFIKQIIDQKARAMNR